MRRATCSRAILTIPVLASLLILIGGTALAKERQLAGIRLNDHAVHLLDVYGPPDGVVTGPAGPAFAPEAAAVSAMGMPGEEMGMGMMAPMGPGGFPEAPGEMEEEMAAPAAVAAAAPGAGVPNWALPVWIDTQAGEMMWLYQRGPVTVGFLLDLDGYVQSIAVAADECSYVRSANWQPHRYIKMGDHYARVLQRYGWADETITYTSGGFAGGAAAPSVSFQSTNKTFSRDCVLRYTENDNNIDFTLHDFKVVRIHIWD